MSDYLPFFFYSAPFAAAAVILIRARLEERQSLPEANDSIAATFDDNLAENIPPMPRRRRYISYTV